MDELREVWAEKHDEHERHYCKYCYEERPTYKLVEGVVGDAVPNHVTRRCYHCDYGLEVLDWRTN